MCSSGTTTGSSSILAQLRIALVKEQEQWTQWSRKGGLQQGDDLTGPDQRNGSVAWLCFMSNALGLGPDTSALAAAILDRMLSTTRVQTKYLRVLALSAFYIACKICEEPEAVPAIPDLVRLAGCVCSVQELVRMERVLLKRLSWDLNLVTPYTCLELMLVISLPSDSCTGFAQYLRPQLDKICCNVGLLRMYRPSLLAAALLSITLERQHHPQWFILTVNLQQLLSASLDEIIACREHLVGYLWPRDTLLMELNQQNHPTTIVAPNNNPPNPSTTFDDAKMKLMMKKKQQARAAAFSNSGNAENVRPSFAVDAAGEGNTRKRQRRKSRCSDGGGGGRMKTAPEEIFIDEIYDAVHVLYGGMEKHRA